MGGNLHVISDPDADPERITQPHALPIPAEERLIETFKLEGGEE